MLSTMRPQTETAASQTEDAAETVQTITPETSGPLRSGLRDRLKTARSGLQTVERETGGRVWAYVGTVIGAGLSIWANVEHSYVPPKGAPETWSPETGSIIFSVFWPICTIIVLELISHAVVLRGWRWAGVRYGALLPVAVVSGVVSYVHISALLKHYGNEKIVYQLGPLAVDGLMVLSAFVVYLTGRAAQTSRLKTQTQTTRVQIAPRKSVVKPVQTEARRPVSTPVQTAIRAQETETQTVETETQTETPVAKVTSLASRSQTQVERLDLIKVAIPDWATRPPVGRNDSVVTDAEITEHTGITGKQTMVNLRAALRAERDALRSTPATSVPDDARELTTVG